MTKQRFITGCCAVLVVGLGLSLLSSATHVQAAALASGDEYVYVGATDLDLAAAQQKSVCVGVWVYRKFLGRWGWWCWGKLTTK